jgi:hypothetical protein
MPGEWRLGPWGLIWGLGARGIARDPGAWGPAAHCLGNARTSVPPPHPTPSGPPLVSRRCQEERRPRLSLLQHLLTSYLPSRLAGEEGGDASPRRLQHAFAMLREGVAAHAGQYPLVATVQQVGGSRAGVGWLTWGGGVCGR